MTSSTQPGRLDDRFDSVRVTDERVLEYLVGALTVVFVVTATSWAIDGLYALPSPYRYLYLVGALYGFVVAVAIVQTRRWGPLLALPYLGSLVGDVLVAGSGFHDPIGTAGTVGLVALVCLGLFVCRDAFRRRDDGRRDETGGLADTF